MFSPVVITVAHHPADELGERVAAAFVTHFDRLGMERAGASTRVPVRLRSQALGRDGSLAPLRAQADRLNVVVVIYGLDMREDAGPWLEFCTNARRHVDPLLGVVAVTAPRLPPFTPFEDMQSVLWFEWESLREAARTRRLLIHVVNEIRRQLSCLDQGEREKIFLSHAKADGKLAAERVVKHMADPTNGLKLSAFYDALELETGEEWRQGLLQAASRASMLAIVTDAYDGRPWCNKEILWAKEFRRPLLLVDIGRSRVERSFPYSGNVMLLHDTLSEAAGIERALLELLSEALRCDLFAIQAQAVTGGSALAYPRPPELADLAFLTDDPGKAIVYPDPPLSNDESALLRKLAGGRRIMPLSDFS